MNIVETAQYLNRLIKENPDERFDIVTKFSAGFGVLHGVVNPKEHIILDYQVDPQARDGPEEERIQDLLRQDEAARRGSSWVD